jgi:hypothetical protein
MTYTKTAMAIATMKANMRPSGVRVDLEGDYDSYSKEKRPRMIQDRFRFEWQDEGTEQRQVVLGREP